VVAKQQLARKVSLTILTVKLSDMRRLWVSAIPIHHWQKMKLKTQLSLVSISKYYGSGKIPS